MLNIVRFIHGGGFVMYPLLLLSLAAVVVIVERMLAFRQYGALAPGLLADALSLTRRGEYAAALTACRAHPGPLAACLSVALEHRRRPLHEIERLVEETGQDYFIRLEHLLPVLDTTTTIAPLLGLLGTIVGMIRAFNAIADQANRNGSDTVLAGVGAALYATATGLVIAVVCFAAYNYFAARLRTIMAQTEQAATKLINALAERRHEEHLTGEHETEKGDEHGVQATARA